MNKNIEIISMIYKSLDYLDLTYNQLKSCKADGWDVHLRIIANDASQVILDKLRELYTTDDVNDGTPHLYFSVYNDPKPDDYYLNRVYRAWNFGGKTSEYDNICFVNSDMVFSDGWLDNLLKHHDGNNIVCSRLVESGKMRSGTHGVGYNCGRSPKQIDYSKWNQYVNKIKNNSVHPGGLFMPVVFNTKRFLESGMYPEGNIYSTGIGNFGDPFKKSGDAYFFDDILGKKYGMKHITVFDSIVYHIQEGELDE
jgi:hypothetical protein